ncbi:MAG: hypothetical protein V3W41_16130 [Planctomycetota bacterium]
MSKNTAESAAEPLMAPASHTPWRAFALWVALGILLGLILWRRQLTPEEAQFLLEMHENPSIPARLQSFWSQWAGTLEKASRSLSLLCLWAGAGCCGLAAYRQLGERGAAAAMIAAVAWPVAFLDGTGIGLSAPFFFAASLSTAFLTWSLPVLGRRGVAGLVGLGVALTPYFLATGGDPNNQEVSTALSRLAPGHGLWPATMSGTAQMLIFSGAAFGLLALGGKRALGNALIFAIPLASFWLSVKSGIHLQSPPDFWVSALLPPLSLLVAESFGPASAPKVRRRIFIALALLLALALAGSWQSTTDDQEPFDPRTSLDWLATGVDQRAWVLLAGSDRHLYRYYEGRGHHPGHQTRLVTDMDEAKELAERSDYFDIPEVVIVGRNIDLQSLFSARYQLAEPREAQPQDVVILQALR